MIFQITQYVSFLTKAFSFAFLSYPTQKVILWSCRYGEILKAFFLLIFLLSQKVDLKEKQVINLDQDVQVCGYFWWMVYGLLFYEPSLLYSFSWIWAIFISSPLFFS
jgi:hypothetical protein